MKFHQLTDPSGGPVWINMEDVSRINKSDLLVHGVKDGAVLTFTNGIMQTVLEAPDFIARAIGTTTLKNVQ